MDQPTGGDRITLVTSALAFSFRYAIPLREKSRRGIFSCSALSSCSCGFSLLLHNLRRSLRRSRRIKFRGFVVKHGCRPRKKILGVRRIVTSLVHRVACECTNSIQRRPPTQRDDFTAIRVEISHCDGGTQVSGCAPIACYAGRADVLHIGGFLWAPNFSTPFTKYWHRCSPWKRHSLPGSLTLQPNTLSLTLAAAAASRPVDARDITGVNLVDPRENGFFAGQVGRLEGVAQDGGG
jgi:hypothetical protein